MRISILFSVVLICLSFSSCVLQEPIEPEYADFIGEWQSDTYALEIFQNGSAKFNSNEIRWFQSRRIEGRVNINDERIRIIGQDEEGGRVRLNIDQFPTLDTDPNTGEEFYFMVLDGEELRRTD